MVGAAGVEWLWLFVCCAVELSSMRWFFALENTFSPLLAMAVSMGPATAASKAENTTTASADKTGSTSQGRTSMSA